MSSEVYQNIAILISYAERALERLLIVFIAGWAVWLGFRLARHTADVIKSGKVEVDAAKWKFMIGSMALPTAILPIVAACAFVGLGLTPLVTTWPNAPSAEGTRSATESRYFSGVGPEKGNPNDQGALVGVVTAFQQERRLEAAAQDADKLSAIETRRELREAEFILIGDVFGSDVETIIRSNEVARTAGGAVSLANCNNPDPAVCHAVATAAALLGAP